MLEARSGNGNLAMTRIFRMAGRLSLVAALGGLAACAGPMGEEPLYVLRDSLGRSVAMAGQSQLGNAAPGTMVRANIAGREQDVMVAERVGMGAVLQAAPPADAPPVTSAMLEAPPLAETAPPAAAPTGDRRQGRAARASAVESGATTTGRRRGPPPRAVSRSVM